MKRPHPLLYHLPSYAETISAQARDLLAKHEVAAETHNQHRFLVSKYAHKRIKKERERGESVVSIYGVPVCIVKENDAPAIRLVRVLG